MRGTRQGFALVTALMLMVVLVGVINLMFVGTIGETRQSRSSLTVAQSRAVAEAGEVYGRYKLETDGRLLFKAQVAPYISAFLSAGKSTAKEPIIPEKDWNKVIGSVMASLNTSHASLPAAMVNGRGSATIRYDLSNLRITSMGIESQTFVADYAVVATGMAGDGRRRIEDRGALEIQVGRPPLSQYLFLVETAQGDKGFFPTGTVFNGPVHANEKWGFLGRPVFKGDVSTASDRAYYWCDKPWSKQEIAGDSRPPCTVPDFQKGFQRNAPRVELPKSVLSQERAALGLNPENLSEPSDSEICKALLGTVAALTCKGKGDVPNGVYVVNNGATVSGGIYVRGDLDAMQMQASGDGKQIYLMQRGKEAWRVTVDYTLGTTTVVHYSDYPAGKVASNKTVVGAPNGHAPEGGGANGQIFVEGKIESFGSPPRTGPLPTPPAGYDGHPAPDQIVPALSRESAVHVTAREEVKVVSDITYECDPTKASDGAYTSKKPRCNLGGDVPRTVFGLMSLNKDIAVVKTAPNDLYLWGAYLAGASGKGLTIEDYDKRPPGTLYLYGSLIQYEDQFRGTVYSDGKYKSGYRETFDYDLRFDNGSVAPPNFPTVRTFEVKKVNPVPLTFKEF